MSVETENQKTEQYTEYINRLPGVLNSKLLVDGEGIKEIHILTDTSRSPKQIVRDVQSLFMAQFQLQFDHRIVSVAQIECETQRMGRNGCRYSIEGITLSKRREGTDLEVCLSRDGSEFFGKQAGLIVSHDIYRGIAAATLEAVSCAESKKRSYSVLDVRFAEIAGERTCMVCVSVSDSELTGCRLVGAALSKDEDALAVVKATLDSLNRKICQS